MPEQLLSMNEIAERLKVSRRTLYTVLPDLRAKGLQMIRAGKSQKFTESSFEKMIKRAAEKEEPLW
jgi:sugar-specific transcriptional regulator TrmB